MMNTAIKQIIVQLCFLALVVPAAGAQQLDLSLPDLGSPSSSTLSAADEQRIGAEMMREIRQQVSLVDDPAVTAYIRDLGARIATATDDPVGQYRFFVIDDERINAFAMPGGYVGVHSGLITASRTESELGAVIAHELAHVTQRHIARRIAAAERSGVRTAALVLAGLLIGTQNPQAGMATATTGMASGIDSQLRYSRAHEREADRVGVRIMANAQLDTHGMPNFFEVLRDDSRYRSQPPAFLSTHPLTESRIADTRERAEKIRPDDPFESPGYAFVRARMRVIQTDDLETLTARFRARLEDDSNDAGAQYGLAFAQLQAGQIDKAQARFEALLQGHGEHALIYLGLAEAAQANARYEQAIERLEQGLSLFPDDQALSQAKVEVYLDDDRPNEALRITRTLVDQNRDAPGLWALHAKAASEAEQAAESVLAMAHFYAVQGDFEAGLSQLRRLEDLNTTPRQRASADDLSERWKDRVTPAS